MLAKRIIPCLDIKDGLLTKGVKFKNNIRVGDGDAARFAKYYSDQGADELIFYDISATPQDKNLNCRLLQKISEVINIPFSVGGGIRTIKEMRKILALGAEKISINSAAVKNPRLIAEGARAFGKQCVVLGVDIIKNKKMTSGYEVYINGGRKAAGLDAIYWIKKCASLGAGEIVVNSIDRDGTKQGYDLRLLKKVKKIVRVPVVASGGAGSRQDIYDVLVRGGADGALLASIIHYGKYEIPQIKKYLKNRKVPIRN